MTDHLIARKLKLIINPEKSRHILYEIPNPDSNSKRKIGKKLSDLPKIEKDTILRKINKLYPFKYKKPTTEREKEATDYIIGKLVSIAVTYQEYEEKKYYSVVEENFDMERIDDFVKDVLQDSSHIAFKIKQTLNFLRYPYLPFETANVDVKYLSNRISEIIKSRRGIKPRIEELIPPPIFNVDILLEPAIDNLSEDDDSKLIEFRTLSSGERQMIYSITSVIYHLINLDSIKYDKAKSKVKYKFVNIILEEVELYFHPEMQRCFVKTLLDSIQNIELTSIKGINICFVTHSPFILSDIPDSNVLFLEVIGKSSQIANRKEKTFGANIHDLLSDGFFMDNGFCGAFAVKKITDTIEFIEYHKMRTKFINDEIENPLQIGIANRREGILDYHLLENRFSKDKKEEHLKLILSIGESVLATKLLEMYDEVFRPNKKEILKREIAKLNKQLKDLE